MSSFGSVMSLISALLFIVILFELFYVKRPFGKNWTVEWSRTKPTAPLYDLYADLAGDAPVPYQISFQDPATPSMEGIIDLHHEILYYVIMLLVFIFWVGFQTISLFTRKGPSLPYSGITHHKHLEWA